MSHSGKKDEESSYSAQINEVERIRRDNNKLWMSILRIALDTAPEDTKRILGEITANDRKISDLLDRVANEN